MFSCGVGGIEQSFMDYSLALAGKYQNVTSLVHPKAKILPRCSEFGLRVKALSNFGAWDPIAVYRIRAILKQEKPDIIIVHGNRAASLLRKACNGKIPIIGVCHNYSIKRLLKCDALFTVTEDLRQVVLKTGYSDQLVHVIPNMITMDFHPALPRSWHKPLVIGTLGRFVKKKGFEHFIKALHILKLKGINYTAILAGNGEELASLKSSADSNNITDRLNFAGWVEDKAAFFGAIDIFCLPSLDEPFGIVLLEALKYGTPIVTTACAGPNEIITHNQDGIIVPSHDSEALASGLESIIHNKSFADQLALRGYKTVQSRYNMPIVANRIIHAIELIKQSRAIHK